MTDNLLFTDTFDGAVGAGWSANWAASNVGGGAVNLDGSGHGRINATAVNAYSRAQATVTDGDDFDFKIAINRSGSSTSTSKIFIAPVADTPTYAANSYTFTFQNAVWIEAPMTTSPNATVKAARNGVVTTGPTIPLDLFATGVYQAIRLRKEGSILYYKKWQDGLTEPSSWNGTWDMTTNGPVGGTGTRRPIVGVVASGSTAPYLLVDNVTVTQIAAAVLDGGYTAQPMTATALSPDAVITAQKIIHRNYTSTVATATGLSVGPTVQTVKADKTTTVTNLTVNYISDGSNLVTLNPATAAVGSSAERVVFSKASLGLPSDAKIGTSYFNFRVSAMLDSSMTFRVQSVDGPYDPNTLNGINKPAMGAIQTAFQTFNTNGQTGSFEVGALVKAIQAGTAYGLALVGNTTGRGSINSYDVNPPTLTINYESSGLAQVVVVPLTGTGLMANPTFSNATVAQINATAAAASAVMTNPAVSLVKHLNVDVPTFDAFAEGPLGGFSVPTVYAATVATASGTAVDASVAAQLNAVVRATASNSLGVLMAPLEAQNSLDDPYYNRLMKTTTDADFWYRLDEQAGSVVKDARGNTAKDADLVGAYNFGVYGPEGRRSMHFDNGYFTRRWAQANYDGRQGVSPYDDVDTSTWTFETVIRTTDGNGILAYGLDRANPVNELGAIPLFRNAITLKNGKVSIDWTYRDRTDSQYTLSGIKNIADGQWHHVAVSFNQGNEFDLGSGLRIVIDGKLDIRRRFSNATPGLWAAPDTYFGMPEAWRNEGFLYPWQKNFVGDVMEVAFRVGHDITSDQTIDLYYDAMGIVPIRVQPATGVGVMPDAKGKGNRQRALVLYVKWNGAGLSNNPMIGDERNAPSGLNSTIPDAFDHNINIGRVFEPGESPWIELAGYRVEAVPIMREDAIFYGDNSGPYRDPVTDMPRLLNLQEDLDMDQYDVILFRNFPDEGADQEVFPARGYGNQDVDDFLNSVKKAVVNGKGLEVTNPYIASRMGLIKGAQAVPMLVDRVRAGTWSDHDKRAAAVNPWDKDKGGEKYMDIHANNWHRVVATVENLTDIPDVEHIAEATLEYNDGVNGKVTNSWGFKFKAGPLQIGEEFIDSIQFMNRIKAYNSVGTSVEWPWDSYLWAITPDGLSVGTPLYKFGNKMWQGNVQVDNPYRDYIGGAIVQPGDTWDGQRVAGKVFINLAENPFGAFGDGEVLTRQIVPPNSEIPNPNDWEDADRRAWDYSTNRVSFVTTNAQAGGLNKANSLTTYVDKDGAVHIGTVTTASGAGLVGVSITEKYPTDPVITPSWALRGFAWLSVKEEIPAGSVVLRPTAATSTGALPEPKVVGQKSVTIGAQASSAIGVLVSPREAHDPDVTVIALPAIAEGRMTGYGKTITVAPFEASGELVDNFDLISAAGEQVVVYLHYADAEVYLKEETK